MNDFVYIYNISSCSKLLPEPTKTTPRQENPVEIRSLNLDIKAKGRKISDRNETKNL